MRNPYAEGNISHLEHDAYETARKDAIKVVESFTPDDMEDKDYKVGYRDAKKDILAALKSEGENNDATKP